MKNLSLLFLVSLLLLSFPACKSQAAAADGSRFKASNVRIMWVAPFVKNCPGSNQECLLVSFKEDQPVQGEWELFAGKIEDFTYEKGNLYKLNVEEKVLKETFVPKSGEDKLYKLLEVLRKVGA